MINANKHVIKEHLYQDKYRYVVYHTGTMKRWMMNAHGGRMTFLYKDIF